MGFKHLQKFGIKHFKSKRWSPRPKQGWNHKFPFAKRQADHIHLRVQSVHQFCKQMALPELHVSTNLFRSAAPSGANSMSVQQLAQISLELSPWDGQCCMTHDHDLTSPTDAYMLAKHLVQIIHKPWMLCCAQAKSSYIDYRLAFGCGWVSPRLIFKLQCLIPS